MGDEKKILTTLVSCDSCGGSGTKRVIDGAAIRRRRLNRNKTLRSVAKCMGISASYLSDIELGRRRPEIEPFISQFLKALERAQ